MSKLSDYLMNNTPAANIPEGAAPGYEDDGSSNDSGFSFSSIQNAASSILDALSHPSFLQGGTVIAPDYTPRQLDDDASDVPIQEANPTYQPYAASTALNNFIQDHTTVIAPNYTPRPLDDSVYSDIPGTPVASGQFGELEDESVRNERMKDSADYMAANWPRLYGGVVAADEGLANVVGGIQNAVGGGNGILDNVQKAEEGMQNYREQWNNEYGDNYFLNPNKFATDVGSGIGSTVPIMALSALMPGAAVAGGTRALTAALSRAGLGRLAMSKAGQALIADTVRSPISSLADSLSEYGTVVNDMMQSGMSEDEARRKAMPMFFKNMALDTLTVPLELGVMKGGKGIATGLLGRGAEEGIGKSLAKGAARTGMLAGASGLTEGYQEGAQNALENDVQGKRDGGWYNPFTWTNEDWEAARGGFVGGALMGIPGNVAAGFHPEAKQAPLSAEAQEQAQGIKDTLSHGKPDGMSDTEYNAYLELANSGDPALIEQAASSLKAFQGPQGKGAQGITGDAATEAYQDYETYDQKETIADFLDNNTVEQIGGEDNYNWLIGVLRNGTPEEVQQAYDTVIAAEKATAEQEAKNRPARSGGSMSPNTGNAMVNAVIQAANDSGVDPRLALAIAARESGGDDINAIHMPDPHDGIYGIMQAQDETVADLGLDSQYPDWQTDPYQNAMVGMAILKSKIANEDGDVWAGVRDYNGAGEEAEQYRQLVKNNYDNMGDIGGGGNVEAPSEAFYDLSDAMNPQVDGMDPNTMAKMNLLARDFYQKYGHRLLVTSLKRNGDGSSYHDEGHAFDFSDDFLEQNPDARDWLVQQGEKYGLKGLDEFSHPVATTDGGNVHFTDHGGPVPGGASGAVAGKITSDDGQFDRELDQAAQEVKNDMDRIQAQSDQAMNEIMNDDSAEKTAQEAQEDAESAQKQAEESQQSAQDDVVPDVAQTIRDTSNNIDEINTLDGMFTKDSNGNDKFIDTPENRDFIKANYKDEITKAVNDAMSKKKAPSATPVPKAQQQTPHARLGRILSTYDRKDPKFKEYMNTFRNGTEQEQQKLADDLQTTQELERANSLKGNPLMTQQDQNAPQQAVESPKHPEHVNTPVQVKESLETQNKRKIYLVKKQKLMERVPAGKTVKVHASTNDAGFDATYKIVPAGDITASHDMNYAVNDLYPAEYQPRDRNRPQMRGQVEKMTKGMKPELLAESQFVNEGAPVVNNSGVVLNGNGRVMAVQKAYKGLTDAHKKSAKAYKDYLVSIAPSLGIAPEKVQSMDHPVLVRQAADDADTSAIINSTEGGAKLGGAEQAKADADRLKLSTLERFVDNGTGEFMNPSNREFRRAAASDVFSDAEGNSVFNDKGDLSPTGAFRIRNAIFAKAYNDNYLLTQLSEATDNNSKNIMNAMIAAAPEVAKVNEGIKEGNLYPDYDISDVITKTAKTIMSLRNEGKPLSFHLQETNLFSQGESEAERLVLEFIERNKFKSRTIADMYKAVCDRIFAVGSPKQSKLFDSTEAPRISLENIISNAIQEVEHGQSLFDTTEEKPAEKAVSEVPDNRQAEPAGSGRVHQQEAGRVQSQEKEGNEVDEKSKQSNHVNAEPQQTESKDKESAHAEEGSQSDVQKEISKFHDLLNSKKSTPKQVVDAYKRIADAVITNVKENHSKATAGEKIITDNRDWAISGYKISDVFIKRRLQREITAVYDNAHKELRTITESAGKEEIKNDADIRFGTVEEAEKDVMEAFGIKPHKKPADTPAVPHKGSTKTTPKKAVKKAAIKNNDKIEKTFHLLDDSDEALEAEKKAILKELSHLSANPAFNPTLMYHLLKFGAIHVQRGLNEFARWAKAMKDTLPQSEPFLQSVWASLQAMPNHAKLDEKQLTAAIRYVGSLYDHGMTGKVDLRKSFIATLGVKNAKYFDAVYNAVMEYPSIEELKGANDNVSSNVPELVARSGEGASENAVGESRIQGRTAVRGSRQDTAPAGKEPQKQGMGHDSLSSGSTSTGRTAGNRRVQTQESKDSTGSTGSTELPGSIRAGLERVPDDDQRRPDELVRAAENRPQHEDPVEKAQEEQKDKHLDEVKKALPMLLPQQAEDVCIAEDRFKEHSGMMFTNGTGTGKTYTGLGIVKRFVDANKKNILIIAPSDGILKQWEEAAAKDFGITLNRLNSTKDAGKGAVTATYANVGANQALVNRDFDLVITDESHNLMGSESATPTAALQLVRAVTGHEDGFKRYHHDKHPEISSKLDKVFEEIKKLRKRDSQIDKERKETHDPSLNDESRKIRDKIEKLEEEMSKWHEKLEAFKSADEKAFAEKQPSKILFLSATPFQYVADLDYANGYLFDYADYGPMEQQGYNQANGRENFYIENFGYKMRYNRLERPGSDVDTDLMEREFNRKMVESGAMHGRMLSSAYDYDRGFIRVDAGVGQKIDEGFQWLWNRPKYRELSDFLKKRFTGQQKYYLLEAIKAKQAIPLIKKYINSGKKVVIFHNFNKGGADNPFVINREGMDYLESLDNERADDILKQYHDFQAQRPDLANLDLNGLESPIKTLSKAFDDELVLYNGTLSKSDREKNKKAFNDDDSKVKVILVQSAAGQAGVSLHDTTGNHQRVLINLGLPTRPSEAIQQEGRIYRVGNKSNAIFRYLNTGTYMEQMAFATKLAERAGTVENIALGEMARSLKQAYVEAFEESQEGDGWKKYLPGSKTEGTGGKANDYRQEQATDFDRAKAVYFGKQKKNSRTKSQEGHDYFATPEPIGYKMVQWLQSKPGQSLLEPSAGDGAIARWMPDNTYNTVVEPSRDLTPKLMRNVAGAKVVESTFENFDLHNKFDGIAMNPPFGHGGKTAVEHVAKAYQHLKDGGRLIAIIPDGSACQKRFDKWFYGDPEAKRKADRGIADGVLMADIHLPSVTFDRAGTNVNTRMVVIDKYTDEGTRQVAEAEARGRIDIDADDVNELFDRIEGMDMPERLDMSDEKKQTSIRKVGQQLSRSKEELKAEIKEAFPNAKEIKDEGDRMTFTMPNGSHIVVDLKNEILLTDKELVQAKKDHHIDDNGNVIVEGYAQLHGKDAYMALSQGSRESTGFHETYHLAEGAVLTDREKAAIKKAIPDAEKRADKYAEWVEARKHGRGTAWGKLFQKIKDFAAKMRKIFTRVESVHDVFRQIESGEVWERNAKTSNVAWTSVTNTAITGKTRVPIVDVSNWGRMNLTNTAKKKAIIEELKGASFKFIDSQGRFATKLDSKHFVNSSSSIQIHLKTRQKIFSNIGEILNNAIYVEKHPDVRHGKSGEYIELFSAVKDGGKIVLFRIVAKEGDKTVGRYNIGDVKFYDILQQKKDVPHHLSHSDRQNGGTSLDTVSVSDLLRNVNDRHNRPYVNSDGTLNYEFGVLKALPTNKTSYSVRKEGATNSTIDQEEAPVKPQDIIDAINDIVHIYEGSRLTDKERKELKEASQFDPDQKQAVRPQATDLYDRHAHAGFNRMGYFNLSNYGRILALHLDNVMQLKGNLELTNKVLDRQDKNAAENKMNGVNERLTPAQARQNAVMDFGAMMIRNPELARETYPAYAKIFDEGLEKHPDLKEKLDRVIQLNETYQGQTAAERATGSIAREKEKVQLRKHPKEWLHTYFDKFYTNWVDDKHIFAKIVAKAEAELGRKLAYDYDVHKQAQMALNVASSRALLFLTGGKSTEDTYKVLNTVYGHAITKNVTMKDIMDALNKVSKEDVSKTGADNAYDALGNYLIAMRTEELEKHYHDAYARSAGFDEEGTREIIQNTPESIKKIAQMYWDINTNIVNILQQQGLISKDLAGKLRKYKYYCPMYRDMSDGIVDMDEMIGAIGAFNKGGGYANVNNGIKRIEGGGKRPILDPITSLSQMAVSMISKCERNDVAKTFVKLGQDFSGLGDIVVRDPTLKHADPTAFAFTVWQNGEQVVYRTTPEIYDALTNNDAQANRFTIKIASGIAHTLRTGATISPSFIVRNLLRDTMSATVNSKTGFYLPFVDNVRGAWKLHFDKEFSAEYHASGASMSTYLRADADSSRDLTKELLGHKYDSYPVVVKQVRQLISYAWHKYEKFGNLVEDSTRAGEFRRARNQGLSIDQAGQLAREITLDFSRHGKKGQMVNKYVPFFNATIQGTDKFIRTFKDNPMRAIMNTVIWIILPSLGLWAINHDDDWYKELDENTKYTNWAIPLPGGTHLLIPKPQEVGILFGSGIEAVLNQMTGTDPHGMKEWARQYAEAMTPSLYPAVVRPLIEWMTNYSFWTGRNLVPASLQKAPSEMQFTSYTSELAKAIGDTWIAKSIKLSPIAIDNWISGWFGSAGRFVANMLNDPISYVRGNSRPSEPAKYWYEMPVIGSFIRQNGQNSEYVNRMYEIQKDMNDDYERSDAGKQRKGKKASSSKPKDLKQVDTAVSSVSKLNKEIKAIRNDPKKDPDRKRREIDQRRTKINDLAKKVVLKFDK